MWCDRAIEKLPCGPPQNVQINYKIFILFLLHTDNDNIHTHTLMNPVYDINYFQKFQVQLTNY